MKKITEDHLFPKGLVIPGRRRAQKLLHDIDPNFRGRQGTFIAQNGVKKATLCADCNNRVLGAELDPELVSLYKAASSELKNIKYPVARDIHLSSVNINKVARAVAGHLLVLNDEVAPRSKNAKHLRRFVLDRDAGLHSSLRFNLWLYPFHKQGLYTDLFHFLFGDGYDPMWVSAFKTYPLAFSFTTEPANPKLKIPEFIDLTKCIETREYKLFNIKLRARPIVDSNWPFSPHTDGGFITMANSNLSTEPYKGRA